MGHKHIVKACLLLILFMMTGGAVSLAAGLEVCAAEPEKEMTLSEAENTQKAAEGRLLDELDFGDIDAALKDIFPESDYTFQDIVSAFLDEKETISPKIIGDYLADKFFYVINTNKPAMRYLLFIAMLAAVLTNFSSVFQNKQIAEMSFYILYMLLIVICLRAFHLTVLSVTDSLDELSVFMKVMGPAFFLSMSIAKGSVSSIAFYNIVLVLIYMIELLILNFVIPLVHVTVMMKILNYISEEEYLSKCAELLELVISWSLKTMLACVVGINLIQGIMSPAIDTVKRNVLTKGAEMIPGIGDMMSGTAEIVLGTAVLIKNGIGIAGAVICMGICVWPILQMGILTLLYKGISALVQPVSDKRVAEAISCVGDGYRLLLKVECTTAVLFLITIAVAASSTS